MTKGHMIRCYRKYNVDSSGYIIGFEYKKKVYMAEIEKILPRFTRVGREASSKGGGEKLDFYLTNPRKEELLKWGAKEIDFVVPKSGNKGRAFEMWVQEHFNQPVREWDNDGFWQGGDICLDGRELQIKFGNSQIVTVTTIHNLQKCGDNWREYKPQRGRKKKVA